MEVLKTGLASTSSRIHKVEDRLNSNNPTKGSGTYDIMAKIKEIEAEIKKFEVESRCQLL